jgi:predicted restriction endonuclease
MLEQCGQEFARLRTERGGAPHKPFLLLSVMDLIAQGRITQKLIEPSYELVDTFNTYCMAIMAPGSGPGQFIRFSE